MSYGCKLFLQFFIIGFHSFWIELNKINSVEQLGLMENSLKESLNQIRSHKVHVTLHWLVHKFCNVISI